MGIIFGRSSWEIKHQNSMEKAWLGSHYYYYRGCICLCLPEGWPRGSFDLMLAYIRGILTLRHLFIFVILLCIMLHIPNLAINWKRKLKQRLLLITFDCNSLCLCCGSGLGMQLKGENLLGKRLNLLQRSWPNYQDVSVVSNFTSTT